MRVDEDPTKSPNAVRPEGTKSRLMSDEDCSRIIRLINDHCTAHATRPRLISPLAQLPVFDNEANPVLYVPFATRGSATLHFRRVGQEYPSSEAISRQSVPWFKLRAVKTCTRRSLSSGRLSRTSFLQRPLVRAMLPLPT